MDKTFKQSKDKVATPVKPSGSVPLSVAMKKYGRNVARAMNQKGKK